MCVRVSVSVRACVCECVCVCVCVCVSLSVGGLWSVSGPHWSLFGIKTPREEQRLRGWFCGERGYSRGWRAECSGVPCL